MRVICLSVNSGLLFSLTSAPAAPDVDADAAAASAVRTAAASSMGSGLPGDAEGAAICLRRRSRLSSSRRCVAISAGDSGAARKTEEAEEEDGIEHDDEGEECGNGALKLSNLKN